MDARHSLHQFVLLLLCQLLEEGCGEGCMYPAYQ